MVYRKGNTPIKYASTMTIASGVPRNTRRFIYMVVAIAAGFILVGLAFLFVAWRSKNNSTGGSEQNLKVVMIAPPSQQTNASMPPVYPTRSPEYPLRHVPQDFQQVGVLVGTDESTNDTSKDPTLLALFGRKMQHKDRWEYYVASDKFHMWKLPVQVQKRVCDDEFGCDEIYNGDQVIVPDYGKRTFTARIYKYASMPGSISHL